MDRLFSGYLNAICNSGLQEDHTISDSAEKPPLLKKPPKTGKMSQVEQRPGLIERDSIRRVGVFWWCFQVLLFDHRGFFSRIISDP